VAVSTTCTRPSTGKPSSGGTDSGPATPPSIRVAPSRRVPSSSGLSASTPLCTPGRNALHSGAVPRGSQARSVQSVACTQYASSSRFRYVQTAIARSSRRRVTPLTGSSTSYPLSSSRPTATTDSRPLPATADQSALRSHSRPPSARLRASIRVRCSTITVSPAMVTLRGVPPTRCCQTTSGSEIGLLRSTQSQSAGNGFQTPVAARTTTVTSPSSNQPRTPRPFTPHTVATITGPPGRVRGVSRPFLGGPGC